jgi:drug/metabolite transporter (DMT)-like permease
MLTGLLAIPIWALLPALTVLASGTPPLELVALTFTIGSIIGLIFLLISATARSDLREVGFRPVLLGISAFFGYHFAYFLALQNAPPVEASLLNYLWPVLIVALSSALPSHAEAGRLTLWHIVGVAIAFAGAALALTGGGGLKLGGNAFGYGMALTAASIWSSYSVATRLFRAVPSIAVIFYCLGTAFLAWCMHAALETFVWPAPSAPSLAIIALGIGPLGIAFYLWDYGCKHGDLRLLGVSAYFAPMLSTFLLMASGLGEPNPKLWMAALLITAGALLTSMQFLLAARTLRAARESTAKRFCPLSQRLSVKMHRKHRLNAPGDSRRDL